MWGKKVIALRNTNFIMRKNERENGKMKRILKGNEPKGQDKMMWVKIKVMKPENKSATEIDREENKQTETLGRRAISPLKKSKPQRKHKETHVQASQRKIKVNIMLGM